MSKKNQKPMTPRREACQYICRKFKISERNDIQYLYRIVDAVGMNFTWKIYTQVRKIEAEGGMMTLDGTRRRTPFGIFCHLVHRQVSPHQRWRLEMPLSELLALIAAQKMMKKIRQAIAEAEGPLVIAAPVVEPEIIEVVQPPAPQMVAHQPEPPKQKNGKVAKPTANKKHDFAASRQARFQMDAPDSLDARDDLPPNVKAKLQQLQGAANVLRERVQQLEANPPAQQMGLEMARKLLASNEGQIAALLAEHELNSEGV
jgi:hypothetical protein